MRNRHSIRAGLAGILVLAAGNALTGCSSLDDRNAASVSAATDTDAGYDALDSALAASVARLEGLSRTPGSPTAYLTDVESVAAPLKNAAGRLADARASLASRTEKQLVAMQDEAAQRPAEGARDLAAKAGKLRVAHSEFDKSAALVAVGLDKGLVALRDVRIAVGASPTTGVVALSVARLDEAAGAFRVVRSRIADAKKALATLRDAQPQPAGN